MSWNRALIVLLLTASTAWGAGRLRAGDVDMRIEATRIRVLVERGVATTEVEQVFANDSDRPGEAAYEFPLPAGATFSGLSIWVNGEEVQGEVLARSRAEEVYTEVTGIEVRPTAEARQRRHGRVEIRSKDPGLLSMEGRKLRLRVAPVPAHGTQRVRIRYVAPVRVESGAGRYVFPMALQGVQAAHTGTLDCEVLLNSAGALNVNSPSHPEGELQTLVPGAVYRFVTHAKDVALDRDLEVRYTLPAQTYPRLTVTAARSADAAKGVVQLTLTPWLPKGSRRAGRDVVLVVDTSASMRPRRNGMLRAAHTLLNALTPRDRCEVVAFDLGARSLWGELKGGARDRKLDAWAFLKGLSFQHQADPRALLRAVARLKPTKGLARPVDVVLITDPSLSDQSSLLRSLATRARAAGVRVFPLELGPSRAAQAPLAELARRTGARAYAADFKGEAHAAKSLLAVLSQPVIRSPTLRFEGVELTEVYPRETPAVLTVGTPIHLYARYAQPSAGRACLEGTLPDGRRLRWTLNLALPARADHLDVSRLWARAAADSVLASLAQPGLEASRRAQLESELLRVSLEGPILTQATALIVLESEALFARHGIQRSNREQIGRERAAQAQREARLDDDVQASRAGARGSTNYSWSGSSGRSGGGAGGPLLLLLGLVAIFTGLRRVDRDL